MFELRPYQKDAVSAAWSYFGAGRNNGLLVIPTGGGKTAIIGDIIRRTYERQSNRKFLLLAPRQELLEQIESTVRKMVPDQSLGLFCASMKRKEAGRKITVGMVNSLFRKPHAVGHVNLVIVDEAHQVPHEDAGMYRTLFNGLRAYNPDFKLLGLTATPYRMKEGLLTDDGLFEEIVYEAKIKDLIAQGYLSKLISKIPRTQADLSEVHSSGGEFVMSEVEKVMDDAELTRAAIDEIEDYGKDRKRWLIFCSGIEHAEHVAGAIRERGIGAEAVSSDNDSLFRREHIRRFKEGELRCLVNCQILTTGFDVPSVDLIAMLRPTKSVGLYQQIVGRGLRIAPEKKDCLVLDFAGNISRHGPIDAIRVITRTNPLTREKESEVSTAPVKKCPNCNTAVIISALECPECNHVFDLPAPPHAPTATTAPILSEPPEAQSWNVTAVDYRKHEKTGKPPSLRVIYTYGGSVLFGKQVSEWICLEHDGYAGRKALKWWCDRTGGECLPEEVPKTVDEALSRVTELKALSWIKIVKDGEYMRVLDFGIDEEAKELDEWKDQMKLNI